MYMQCRNTAGYAQYVSASEHTVFICMGTLTKVKSTHLCFSTGICNTCLHPCIWLCTQSSYICIWLKISFYEPLGLGAAHIFIGIHFCLQGHLLVKSTLPGFLPQMTFATWYCFRKNICCSSCTASDQVAFLSRHRGLGLKMRSVHFRLLCNRVFFSMDTK